MAATSIQIATAFVPRSGSSREAGILPSDLTWDMDIKDRIRTLSAKNTKDPYLNGLIYVPDLLSDDCKKAEEEYIRKNATRLRNLPKDWATIALAPWFSPECTLEYFESARNEQTQAFLVYQPGKGTQTPPTMQNETWLLGDGGRWKSTNKFPTYAIMSLAGEIIAEHLGQYSGNVTTVPNGQKLEVELKVHPDDYVRIWARIQTDVANKLPSLWVFLCIVVGLLLVIVLCISFFMHFVQRRRREDLRQRIINGEVDLEAMGIKRVAVPKEIVEKFPLCIYTDRDEKDAVAAPARTQPDPSPHFDPELNTRHASLFRRHSVISPSSEPQQLPPTFSQPTCPICLDDFEPQQTQVRQLPCQHVYHPECIDTFLIQRSSLCPLCKESVLPPGFCPVKITNVMVRRERMLARMRAQRAQRAAGVQPTPSAARRASGPFLSLGSRVSGAISGRRVFSAPEHARLPSRDIEMASTEPPQPSTQPAAGPSPNLPASHSSVNVPAQECEQAPNPDRNTLLHQRALALLGNNQVPETDEESGPRWKRLFRNVFPGFR